jgi:hypothetical protein
MTDSAQPAPAGPGTGRLWAMVAIGLLACAASLAYAVFTGDLLQGGRGGVVALILTFAMLFLGRDTETQYLEMDLTTGAEDDIDRLKALNNQTRNALAAMIDWNNKHKLPLALLSIVGTAVAGFGDLAAAVLRAIVF